MLAALVLSGCVHVPSRPRGPIPADLAELEQWQARGRIGVSSTAGGGSGSFQWQQRGDQAGLVGLRERALRKPIEVARPQAFAARGLLFAFEPRVHQLRLGRLFP